MNTPESKIDELLDRLKNEKMPPARMAPKLTLNLENRSGSTARRPQNLPFNQKQHEGEGETDKNDKRLREIMSSSGKLKIREKTFSTDIKDMEHMEELGNGTCGHVVKMRHNPSGEIIAVKQMRRTGNNEENKRIVMDIEVVLKSHGCPYIVQCLGCFITKADVWICMELMATCFDKLLKRLKQPIPERILGKVTVATVKALAYLKDNHGIIHRDVKPSNILLDEQGNVKLCDFGISGRLVDSMAATKSAGCTAYLAPERIEIDPNNPDYDIRADVWSLGITLVELATGVFPYQDCQTDFEVLAKVISQDPPTLPSEKEFSEDFRNFVHCCLKKDQKDRPKYVHLKKLPFYKNSEAADVNVGLWFLETTRTAESRHTQSVRKFAHVRQHSEPPPRSVPMPALNGRPHLVISPETDRNSRCGVQHMSRISSFQRDIGNDRQPRTYSPLHAYQEHLLARTEAERRHEVSPLPLRRDKFRSPVGNSLHPSDESSHSLPYNSSNTSPIVLQRFYHQQKQQQQAKEAEECLKNESVSGKKLFATCIKLHLNNERSGRSSRHQSPEPPPRLHRGVGDNQSPLALRRHFFENNASMSPSLSRRYISPAPPVPPPRRLSESTSVPGSPQHVRARIHYTPEPQRRLFHNSDVS